MKQDKLINIGGKKVPVAQVKHWPCDSAKDGSTVSELNQRRFQALARVFSAWDALNVSLLEDVLFDESFEYSSHWVTETMYGKAAYLEYLKGKFETIRNTGGKPSLSVVELTESLFPVDYSYAIHMRQGSVETLLLFSFANDKVCKLSMSDSDIFSFYPSICGILDGNGEPRMFIHQAEEGESGKPLNKQEFHSFAVSVVAGLFKEDGWTVANINHLEGTEYPSLVLKFDGVCLYILIESVLAPAKGGTICEDALTSFKELAHEHGAKAIHLVAGFYCMETNGHGALAGATYALRFFN